MTTATASSAAPRTADRSPWFHSARATVQQVLAREPGNPQALELRARLGGG